MLDRPLLVVEDDDMVRRLLVRFLRGKFTVTEARDAETALALIEAGAWFDAIVCDLHLGGMSGRDLVMKLAATHSAQAQRIVILSGNPSAMDEDLLRAISSRFIEKPAALRDIEAMISDLVSAPARAA